MKISFSTGSCSGFTFGIGGFVVAQCSAFEVACFAVNAFELVLHFIVQVKKFVRLFGGHFKFFGEPLVLIFTHFTSPGDAVFVGHVLSRGHQGHGCRKDECGYEDMIPFHFIVWSWLRQMPCCRLRASVHRCCLPSVSHRVPID